MARPAAESARLHFATFEDDRAACSAALDCREQGIEIVDVFGPYPVHGIDRALGLRPSRLTWACFLFGLAGLVLALWLQYWTSAVDWPLNVGGKPFDSLPAFVPVAFELTVLLAGLGTVAAFLCRSRLLPGRRSRLAEYGVTDDHFVIAARGCKPGLDGERLDELWRRHGAARTWTEMTEV